MIRLYIEPEYRNLGIGKKIIKILPNLSPFIIDAKYLCEKGEDGKDKVYSYQKKLIMNNSGMYKKRLLKELCMANVVLRS